MKVYVVKCPRCGWQSGPVEKYVADKFEELRVCQNCKADGVQVPWKIQEKVTFLRKRIP